MSRWKDIVLVIAYVLLRIDVLVEPFMREVVAYFGNTWETGKFFVRREEAFVSVVPLAVARSRVGGGWSERLRRRPIGS